MFVTHVAHVLGRIVNEYPSPPQPVPLVGNVWVYVLWATTHVLYVPAEMPANT